MVRAEGGIPTKATPLEGMTIEMEVKMFMGKCQECDHPIAKVDLPDAKWLHVLTNQVECGE